MSLCNIVNWVAVIFEATKSETSLRERVKLLVSRTLGRRQVNNLTILKIKFYVIISIKSDLNLFKSRSFVFFRFSYSLK